MASKKAKTKQYRVQKRFDFWAGILIDAENFDDACAKSKELCIEDFVDWKTEDVIDHNQLPGFGVSEEF